MSLTVDDLNAVRAQWEEWTADSGFHLFIEVREDNTSGPCAVMIEQAFGARIAASLYCLVEIWRGPYQLVFSEHVPYDARALRASIAVLSRAIAAHAASAEAEAEQ